MVLERYEEDYLGPSCKNEEVLRRIKRKGSFYTQQKEGRVGRVRREGRNHKHLLDVLREKRSCWNLKEEAQYRTVWRTHFERGSRIVGRHFVMDDVRYRVDGFAV